MEAPYLQLVMERLWERERSQQSRLLRFATLASLGGAAEIVRAHLERALAALTEEQRDVAAASFNHLVTPSGSKIAHAPADLARYAGVGEEELLPVLSTPRAAANPPSRRERDDRATRSSTTSWPRRCSGGGQARG